MESVNVRISVKCIPGLIHTVQCRYTQYKVLGRVLFSFTLHVKNLRTSNVSRDIENLPSSSPSTTPSRWPPPDHLVRGGLLDWYLDLGTVPVSVVKLDF